MRARRSHDESGIALIAVLLALVLLSAMGAALASIGSIEYRTAVNHRSATQALLLADAGAAHALALLRGPLAKREYTELLTGLDGTGNTADDGILALDGVVAADALPAEGVRLGQGRYYVRLVNDPEDPSGSAYIDSNQRVVAVCQGTTDDGGEAEVRVLIGARSYPAIATNGDLDVPGNSTVLGECAGVHTNRDLSIGGSNVVDGKVSASDKIKQTGTVRDAEGNPVEAGYGEPIDIPELDPLDYCGEANYLLANGYVVTLGPARDSVPAGAPTSGWDWDPGSNTYTAKGAAQPGTVCALGNVEVGGGLGSEGNPLPITIAATGSVKLAGNPSIRSSHSDNVLIVSGGDVEISGNASGTTPNFEGTIYAHSQCQVNGNPIVDGQLLCYDAPDEPGNTDLVKKNKLNGNPHFRYDCSGLKRKAGIDAWWEVRAR